MERKLIKITDVGLDMSSIKEDNGIITGTATIYSLDCNGEDCYDDFEFYYETTTGFVNCEVDEKVFGDFLEEIDIMLVDNLKTNYL